MSLAADAHIILNVHQPKRNATIGSGAPAAPAADEITVRITTFPRILPSGVVVGMMRQLRIQLLSVLGTAPTTAVVDFRRTGAKDVVINGVSNDATDIIVTLGSNLRTKGQSHFIDRTMKRLEEIYLENTKDE